MKPRKKEDWRTQLYESIRITKKAKAALKKRAAKEKRTMIATLDNLLGL